MIPSHVNIVLYIDTYCQLIQYHSHSFLSCVGVFLPMMVSSFSRFRVVNLIFVFLTQFGTGVIFSTALVHVRVNECFDCAIAAVLY